MGARPQFIKAATLSRWLRRQAGVEEILIHTGQHFDRNMSAVFFEELALPVPDHQLNIHSLPHGAMTGRMLEALESLFQQIQPNALVVYGDTNSTLAGALAAAKLQIPIAHVEAGLRSFNRAMPEELNRILTDQISDWLFVPSQIAKDHLLNEGRPADSIYLCGDIMRDSVEHYRRQLTGQAALAGLGLPDEFVLATLHRQENLRDTERLKNIFEGLGQLNRAIKVVLPVHPALKPVLPASAQALHLIEPQPYLSMLNLIDQSRLVLTDSGGLQKEAYYFQKFCLTLRDETEWTELVGAGANILAGADPLVIEQKASEFLHKSFTIDPNLYGRGDTADQIGQILLSSKG